MNHWRSESSFCSLPLPATAFHPLPASSQAILSPTLHKLLRAERLQGKAPTSSPVSPQTLQLALRELLLALAASNFFMSHLLCKGGINPQAETQVGSRLKHMLPFQQSQSSPGGSLHFNRILEIVQHPPIPHGKGTGNLSAKK